MKRTKIKLTDLQPGDLVIYVAGDGTKHLSLMRKPYKVGDATVNTGALTTSSGDTYFRASKGGVSPGSIIAAFPACEVA